MGIEIEGKGERVAGLLYNNIKEYDVSTFSYNGNPIGTNVGAVDRNFVLEVDDFTPSMGIEYQDSREAGLIYGSEKQYDTSEYTYDGINVNIDVEPVNRDLKLSVELVK